MSDLNEPVTPIEAAIVSTDGSVTTCLVGGTAYAGPGYSVLNAMTESLAVVVSLANPNTRTNTFRVGTEYIFDEGIDWNGVTGSNSGSVYMANNTKATFLGSTFSDNRQNKGGGLYTLGETYLNNSLFQSNVADSEGGAIWTGSSTSKVIIANSTFTANTATTHGGAIMLNNPDGAYLSIDASTFTRNQATSHGGALFLNQGTASVTNSIFQANVKAGTGNNGVVAYVGCTATFDNCWFDANINPISGSDVIMFGGGSTATLTGSTFTANTASYAVAVDNGKLEMKNVVINGNSASGLRVTGDAASVKLDGTTITNTLAGRAFHKESAGLLTIKDSYFAGGSVISLTTGGLGYITGGTTNVTGSTFYAGSVATTGNAYAGAIYISGGTNTFESTLIDSCYCRVLGGAIQQTSDNAKTTFIGSTFSNNKTDMHASVLHLQKGTFTLLNSLLSNNRSPTYGNFLTGGNSQLTIKNTVIDRAEAKDGVAITNESTTTLIGSTISNGYGGSNSTIVTNTKLITIDDTLFTGNSAVLSAGLYNVDGTVNVIGSTFATNQGRSTASAIFNRSNASTATAKVSDTLFIDNYGGQSGAIQNTGVLEVTGSTFSNNRGVSNAGGIYNYSAGTASVVNSLFDGNTTTGTAGGIANEGLLSLDNVAFQNNLNTNSSNAQAIANSGILTARNVLVTGHAIPKAINLTSGTATFSNSTFTNNNSLDFPSGSGGVINNGSGALLTINDSYFGNNQVSTQGAAIQNSGTTTINGCTFTANSAYNNSNGYGGSIYNYSGLMTINNSLFENSYCRTLGGAIFSREGNLNVNGSTFSKNKTNSHAHGICVNGGTGTINNTLFQDNNAGYGYGGGLYSPSIAFVDDATFTTNRSGYGGGWYSGRLGTVSNTLFQSNTSTIAGGGAIYASGNVDTTTVAGTITQVPIGTISVSDSTFNNNIYNGSSATESGGAIRLINVVKAEIAGSTFTGNSSAYYGGAIGSTATYIGTTISGVITYERIANSLEVSDSVFDNNLGNRNGGGAIYTQASSASISGSTFTGNTSTSGGAIFCKNETTTISNSLFSDNKGNSGGAVYANSTDATVSACSFQGNSSTADCGAIYFDGDANEATVSDATFTDNSSEANGGAIYTANLATNLSSVTFTGNTALYGSGVYNVSGNLTMSNVVFDANSASTLGGALFNSTGKQATITDAVFNGNYGGSHAGAIFNQASTQLNITGATFSANTTRGSGAGLYTGGVATLTNVVFEGNIAGSSGGAIYNDGTVTLNNAQFLTASDSIDNRGGILNLTGAITLNANLSSTGTATVNGATFTFAGDTAISVSALTLAGDGITGVTFSNTGTVAFTSLDLGGKAITVDTGNVWRYGTTTFATGITSLDGATFTVNGATATLGTALDNGAVLKYTENALTLTVDFVEVNTPYQDLDEALAITGATPGLITFAEATDGTTCTFSGNTIGHDQVFQGNGATNTAIASASASMVFCNGNDIDMNSLAWNGILYGGKLGGDSSATSLSFQDAAVGGNIFGGGRANTGGTVADGAVSLTLADSTQAVGKAVYGGGYANGGTATADSVSLTLADVNAGSNSIYGGGAVNNGGKMTASSVSTEISGGVYGAVYNGANIYTAGTGSSFGAGDMSLEIGGGTFNGAVGNGSTPRSGASSVQGASTLAITGGLFQRVVYGGGASFGGNATVDSTTVTISGGTFNGKVFGGNVGQTGAMAASTDLRGNASLTIDSSASDIYFNGNVFGGSMGTGNVGGNVTVTFKGDGSRLHFGSSNFVSGASEYAYGAIDYVEGTRTLVFDGFTGTFNANIQGPAFETVTIKNGSAVNVCGGSVNQDFGFVSTWNFELGDSNAVMTTDDVSATNVKSSFYGATINLTFADGASVGDTDWTVYQGQESTLNYWNELGTLTIGGVAATSAMDGDFMAWSTTDYKVYIDSNYDIRLAKLA